MGVGLGCYSNEILKYKRNNLSKCRIRIIVKLKIFGRIGSDELYHAIKILKTNKILNNLTRNMNSLSLW